MLPVLYIAVNKVNVKCTLLCENWQMWLKIFDGTVFAMHYYIFNCEVYTYDLLFA